MKNRYWVLLIVILLLVSVWGCCYVLKLQNAKTAEVLVDGKHYCTLQLDKDTELEITTENGTNVITVSGGKVAMTSASCPDKLCVKRGASAGGMPIVCLPNHVVVQFPADDELDAVVG